MTYSVSNNGVDANRARTHIHDVTFLVLMLANKWGKKKTTIIIIIIAMADC